MLNNLTNEFADREYNLIQLAEVLELQKAKNSSLADCTYLKILKNEEIIAEGYLDDLLIKKLLDYYGDDYVQEFSFTFDNMILETRVVIQLR